MTVKADVNVCFWAILKAVCQALFSKMNISPITSEWSHIFIIAIWHQNWKTVLSCSITKMFWVHLIIFTDNYIKKNSKTVLKPCKNTIFFCLVIYLKETEPGLCSVACQSSYYLGKDGNMEKKYLLWEPILRHLLYLHRHWG